MESDTSTVLDAMHWQDDIVFGGRSFKTTRSNWKPIVFAVVFFLHAAMIAYGFYWQKDFQKTSFADDEAMQVSFIERISIAEPESSSAEANHEKRNSLPRSSATIKKTTDSLVLTEAVDIPDRQSLRLTMDVDEWESPATVTPRNPLHRQHIALAGRAEPFVHGIKFTNKLTPRQKLQMVGKLFGAVDYDPCKEARNRMASGQSQANDFDLERDLQTIAHHCRP